MKTVANARRYASEFGNLAALRNGTLATWNMDTGSEVCRLAQHKGCPQGRPSLRATSRRHRRIERCGPAAVAITTGRAWRHSSGTGMWWTT